MLVDVFLTVGVVIPIVFSDILYGERIGLNDLIGLAILIAATAVMCSYSNGIKQKLRVGDLLLMALSGTANGFLSLSQKIFVKSGESCGASVFNFYTYIFSASVLMLFLAVALCGERRKTATAVERIADSEKPQKRGLPASVMIYVTVMAVCLFAHSFFNTLAADRLTAARLYPLSQSSSLVLASIMAAVFFGEKIKPRSVIGITLTFIGLLVINLL